ncbi:MAG: KEOPS complex kinase/ATPase Bud32 [Candidatus Nanoarchaeia archaeon]
MKKVIGRGAEAILYLENGKVIKERIKKGYRHRDIDLRIRKSCTRREHKLLVSASSLINVPRVFEFSDSTMRIVMEFVEGKTLRDILDDMPKKERLVLCEHLGKSIALLHDANIIHGDLTTSNFILKDGKIFFIDFGLGFFSTKIEDKAVDLHLLRQALESKHYKHFEECFEAVIQGYVKTSLHGKAVLERFVAVEKRGRYKRKGS